MGAFEVAQLLAIPSAIGFAAWYVLSVVVGINPIAAVFVATASAAFFGRYGRLG